MTSASSLCSLDPSNPSNSDDDSILLALKECCRGDMDTTTTQSSHLTATTEAWLADAVREDSKLLIGYCMDDLRLLLLELADAHVNKRVSSRSKIFAFWVIILYVYSLKCPGVLVSYMVSIGNFLSFLIVPSIIQCLVCFTSGIGAKYIVCVVYVWLVRGEMR